MKKIYTVSAILIMVYCTLLPIICIGKGEGASSVKKPSKSSVTTESENDQIVRILDEKSGKITEMSVDDYIFGVVAAEMPASYCDEALKAQTVTSYTYMLFRKNERADLDYDVIAYHRATRRLSRGKTREKNGATMPTNTAKKSRMRWHR